MVVVLAFPVIALCQTPGGGQGGGSINGSVACTFLKTIRDVFYLIGGTIVVISWTIAAIMYLTASGSADRMGKAKTAMVAAIIGTIILVLAPSAMSIVNSFLNGTAVGSC